MKVTCESCYFAFDIDDAKIPPSGVTATCPVCMQQFKVQKGGAAVAVQAVEPPAAPPATGPRELELSPLGDGASDGDNDDSSELPTPKGAAPPKFGVGAKAPPVAKAPPAAKAPPPPKAAPPPLKVPISPKAPPPAPTLTVASPTLLPSLPLSPAEASSQASSPSPPPSHEMDEIDLPGVIEDAPSLPSSKGAVPSRWEPVKPIAVDSGPPELAPADQAFGEDFGIGLDDPDADDLPAPVDPNAANQRFDEPELPTAATAKPLKPPMARPVAPPETAELPEAIAVSRSSSPELPVAKTASPELPVSKDSQAPLPVAKDSQAPLPTPKTDVDGVTAKPMETNVVAKEVELPRPLDLPIAPTSASTVSPSDAKASDTTIKAPAVAAPLAADDKPALPSSRRRIGLLVGGALSVTLLGGGAWFLLATEAGQALLGGGGTSADTTIANARKQLVEDTLPSYRKASAALKGYMEQHGETPELLGLEAQAHLGAARLGVAAEAKAADSVFTKLEQKKNANEAVEVKRAEALRKLVQKQPAEAQALLQQLLQAAPADATTLVYQGWLELAAGDATAAAATLKKAVDAEGTRGSALYALGRAKELLGENDEARTLYKKTLLRSPQHFRAELGLLRLGGETDLGRTTYSMIEALIQKRLDTAAPRELAEAWATAGLLARDDGRRDVAEDRLRKAVALDADLAIAHRELARVLLQVRRPKEALVPAKKALELQPKSKEARLLLFGVYVEAGDAKEALATLQPLLPDAAKLPFVQYYQGRLALLGEKPDANKALDLLNAAVVGDSKLLEASLWKSQTLQKLGRADEAVATLKLAETAAASDPVLTLELGDAYRELERHSDAEARYRAVLEKSPDDTRARMGLAMSLESQNKLDLAMAELDKLRKSDAKVPGLSERLARIFKREGKLQEAAAFFDAALQESSPSAALRLEAAELHLMLKSYERAQSLADSVAKEDERGPRAHLLLARIALERNRLDDALMSARRSAMLGDMPEAHYVLGQVLEAMGKNEQAVTEYAVARRGPIEQDASLGRARIMARLGATRDALDELTPLSKVPRLRAQALLLMGDCYADQQQRDKARKAYEEAARADRNSSDAAFKLGRALLDGGKASAGIDELNRALKLAGDKAPFAAEAYLLLGDAHRDKKATAPALAAYQKYLALAPLASPSRTEVQKQIRLLGGTPQ